LPSFLALESPIAIACLGFVTFLPLRPDLSLPCFISFISVSTFLPADGEYLRRDDFFAEDFLVVDFLAEDFFAEDFLALVLRLLLLLFFAEVLLRVLLDLFFAAFFVAILSSLKIRCARDSRQLYVNCSRVIFLVTGGYAFRRSAEPYAG
jgi:hypothetical protein